MGGGGGSYKVNFLRYYIREHFWGGGVGKSHTVVRDLERKFTPAIEKNIYMVGCGKGILHSSWGG